MKRRYFVFPALGLALFVAVNFAPQDARAENEDLEGYWTIETEPDYRWPVVVSVAGNAMRISVWGDRWDDSHGSWFNDSGRNFLATVRGNELEGYVWGFQFDWCPYVKFPLTGTISADRSRIDLFFDDAPVTYDGEWGCRISGSIESEHYTLIRP